MGIAAEPAFALALLVHATILAVTSVGGVTAYLATRGRPAGMRSLP
jgi:hypothetical protein